MKKNRINKITLNDVLPHAFAGSVNRNSQVWQQPLSFDIGESYLVSAESGTGKSSLCSYIYGNRHDYSGEICFDGKDVSKFGFGEWVELRTRHLAILPQEMRLFGELTALENIDIKNRLTGYKTEGEIAEMLERLEIADKANAKAGRLSIGQQQRVAIVRALCQPMDFLLLDEPVSHLDERCNSLVAQLIAEEVRKQGAAVIATSVGVRISMNFSHEIYL